MDPSLRTTNTAGAIGGNCLMVVSSAICVRGNAIFVTVSGECVLPVLDVEVTWCLIPEGGRAGFVSTRLRRNHSIIFFRKCR